MELPASLEEIKSGAFNIRDLEKIEIGNDVYLQHLGRYAGRFHDVYEENNRESGVYIKEGNDWLKE